MTCTHNDGNSTKVSHAEHVCLFFSELCVFNANIYCMHTGMRMVYICACRCARKCMTGTVLLSTACTFELRHPGTCVGSYCPRTDSARSRLSPTTSGTSRQGKQLGHGPPCKGEATLPTQGASLALRRESAGGHSVEITHTHTSLIRRTPENTTIFRISRISLRASRSSPFTVR